MGTKSIILDDARAVTMIDHSIRAPGFIDRSIIGFPRSDHDRAHHYSSTLMHEGNFARFQYRRPGDRFNGNPCDCLLFLTADLDIEVYREPKVDGQYLN